RRIAPRGTRRRRPPGRRPRRLGWTRQHSWAQRGERRHGCRDRAEHVPREGVGVRVTWSSNVGARGAVDLAAGQRFVVARRMDLPGDRLVTSVPGQDHLVLVRLPYVSDPALVVTATD